MGAAESFFRLLGQVGTPDHGVLLGVGFVGTWVRRSFLLVSGEYRDF